VAEEKKVKVKLTVSVSEADGYGGPGKPGDEVEVPADLAERMVEAGIAEKPGTAAEKPVEEPPADNGGTTGSGYTGRRRQG